MSRCSRQPRIGSPSMTTSDGYIHWNVLSGITLHCAPVSTLTRSVSVVLALSLSVIMRVAYTSSLLTAFFSTLSIESNSKLSHTVGRICRSGLRYELLLAGAHPGWLYDLALFEIDDAHTIVVFVQHQTSDM